MTTSRRRFAFGLAAAGLLAGCERIAGTNAAPTFHFTDITGAEFARKLELPDVDGKPHSLADWNGKVTVVFFGYTQCPDVCPTTMAELAQIRKLLGAMFSGYAWRLWRGYSDALARKTFRFSIVHLTLLFAALLVDHYLWPLFP